MAGERETPCKKWQTVSYIRAQSKKRKDERMGQAPGTVCHPRPRNPVPAECGLWVARHVRHNSDDGAHQRQILHTLPHNHINASTDLLTVHEHIPACSEGHVDVRARIFEIRADVDAALVHDFNLVAGEAVLFREREPRHIEHLHEVAYVVRAQQGGVLYGG
jgi:hypothetical protein